MTPRLTGVRVTDPPEVWERLGFAVRAGRFAVGGVTVDAGDASDAGPASDGDGRVGVTAWALDPQPPRAHVDGLALTAVPPADEATHPNGVTALDHLVVGTSDVERTTAALAGIGVEARDSRLLERGGRTSLYRFFLLGTAVLEVIGPPTPTSDRPARFLGLAFTTVDLDGLAGRLGDGCGPPHDAVQPGRRIAAVRAGRLGLATPTAFLTPRVSTG